MGDSLRTQRQHFRGRDVGLPAIGNLGWGRHSAARQALTPHEHGNAYEICFIADGSVQWWVEDEIHTVEAGQIYLTKPGETHGGIDDVMHPCELFWLIFTLPKRGSLPGLTSAETADLGNQLKRFTQRCFDASAALEAAYRTMLSAFADNPDHQQLVIRTALHQLLLELVRCHDRHTQRHEAMSSQIAKAAQWIDNNASENFNLDAVAKTVGLGISQFHARFRKETGLTPARYRTRQRIEQAKHLLRDTTRPVTDIAMTCGFATSQYFATVFRQQVGMHAGAYREKLKAKTPASEPAPFAVAHGAASSGRRAENRNPQHTTTTPPPGRLADERSESRGYHWRHAVLHTRGAWLPGDPRGFRARNHKIHSSGNYKNPPPPGEHAGLFAYSKMLRPKAITIPTALRSVVGQAIIDELRKQRIELLTLCVCAQHVHLQVKLPDDDVTQWKILGDCKRVASHAVRKRLPGSIWGRKGRIERIKTREHHQYLHRQYIPRHKKEGAWVWDFRKGVLFDPAAR